MLPAPRKDLQWLTINTRMSRAIFFFFQKENKAKYLNWYMVRRERENDALNQ